MGFGQLLNQAEVVILSSTCHLVVARPPRLPQPIASPASCNKPVREAPPRTFCYILTSSESGQLDVRAM